MCIDYVDVELCKYMKSFASGMNTCISLFLCSSLYDHAPVCLWSTGLPHLFASDMSSLTVPARAIGSNQRIFPFFADRTF